jgi:hypothetical protein
MQVHAQVVVEHVHRHLQRRPALVELVVGVDVDRALEAAVLLQDLRDAGVAQRHVDAGEIDLGQVREGDRHVGPEGRQVDDRVTAVAQAEGLAQALADELHERAVAHAWRGQRVEHHRRLAVLLCEIERRQRGERAAEREAGDVDARQAAVAALELVHLVQQALAHPFVGLPEAGVHPAPVGHAEQAPGLGRVGDAVGPQVGRHPVLEAAVGLEAGRLRAAKGHHRGAGVGAGHHAFGVALPLAADQAHRVAQGRAGHLERLRAARRLDEVRGRIGH